MKLISTLFISFFCCVMLCPSVNASDNSVSNIQNRGKVYCGTNKNNSDLAYKGEDGSWHGFDSVICRAVSAALLGNKELFEMKPINMASASKLLKEGRLDVVIGEFALPAETEITSNIFNIDVLYNEKVMLLAHKIENATSMEAYKGAKICMVRNSIDTYYLNNFNDKYNLELKRLFFPSREKAAEAFYLNRCMLLPGASNELKEIIKNNFKGKDYVEILPETIGLRPVYIMVDKGNTRLAITIKWILNALRLAEIYDITSENIPLMLGDKDTSVQNLLGTRTELWDKFKVNPTWIRKFIAEEGNYGEIYERNLGPNTPLNLDMITPERGLATPKPFI